jgi:hypothetical protein
MRRTASPSALAIGKAAADVAATGNSITHLHPAQAGERLIV